MGGTKEPDPHNDDAKDVAVIRTAHDCGVTLIQTAQNYAAGKCEEIVGAAVKDYPRESYQVITMQSKLHLGYDEVIAGCKASLQRLGLEYLDYFACHAPNTDFDMHDFFRASNQLYKVGLIKNVGVSNFGPKMLQLAIETSAVPIAFNQVCFSVTDSDILHTGTYDFCVAHDIPVLAYRPLVEVAEDQEMFALLTKIAQAHQLTAHQVAIAYLRSYPKVHFTIRASSAEHWQQLKDALKITLTSEEITLLKKVHRTKRGQFAHFQVL